MTFGIHKFRRRLLQGLLPLLRTLPPKSATRFVAGLGRFEFRLNPVMQARYRAALNRAQSHFACRWDSGSIGASLAGNHLRWHARDKLFDGLNDQEVAGMLEVVGREHLDHALAEGKGAVLLFNHFGPFLMPAHWLVRNGYPLRWFTERPRNISKLVEETFATDGPLGQRDFFISRKLNASEGGAAIRKAVRMLHAGLIVQLAGDVRWTGTRCAPGRFLGRDYHFTTTWITLAALTQAPVVPVFSVMKPDGSYRVEFLEPQHIPRNATRPETSEAWVQRNLDAVEDWIRRYPENSNDYLFWSESGSPTDSVDV